MLVEGFDSCSGINYKNIVAAGANAEQAIDWIKVHQLTGMNTMQEALLLIQANRDFEVFCKFDKPRVE